jgi:hypothetical protein
MRKRIRSLVCKSRKHTSVVATVAPDTSGVPHAMVGTAYSALSPVDGLFRHRSGNYDLPPPSRTKRRLAISFRRQHRGARTTRLQPSASDAVVIRGAFHSRKVERRKRPLHPTPRIVTIAKRPS